MNEENQNLLSSFRSKYLSAYCLGANKNFVWKETPLKNRSFSARSESESPMLILCWWAEEKSQRRLTLREFYKFTQRSVPWTTPEGFTRASFFTCLEIQRKCKFHFRTKTTSWQVGESRMLILAAFNPELNKAKNMWILEACMLAN